MAGRSFIQSAKVQRRPVVRTMGFVASVSCLSLGGFAPAHAREASAPLEEVIVTAQKRLERLQDVPVAVSVLNTEALVNSNQLRLEDYYSRIPGVTMTLAGNGSEPMIIIRGMSTSIVGNPTAGVVIDDIPYGRSSALGLSTSVADIDPGDLERVEVLRGPQGTLYGASSIGGLLKYVTVDPSTEAFSSRLQVGSTYVSKGDDLGHSVRGAVNVPLGETLAVRLSGFTQEDPGYIDNVQTGEEDINSRESQGGRLSALWRPGETFSMKVSAVVQDTERNGMADSDRTYEPNLARAQLRGMGGTERKSNAYSATMTAKLGPVDLVSGTGYSIDELTNNIESLGLRGLANTFFPGTGRASLVSWFENTKFSQELRASMPIGDRLHWLVGVFYTEEKDQTRINALANRPNGDVAGLLVRNSTIRPTTFEERAIFTNLTVDVTDRFDVQFGGRFSENDQVYTRASVLAGANSLNAPYNFFQTSRSDESAFTYLITPRFKISQDLMTYLRVSSGYRPGGPNFNCGLLPASICEFDSDTSVNYEIGAKGTAMDRMLSFEAAIYYIDWKDLQVGPLNFASGIQYLTNASRATSKGVELSVEARPFDGFKVSSWVSYNEAELAEPMPAPFSNGSTFIRKGQRLPNSSPWTGGLSLEQEIPLWNGVVGFVGLDGNFVDARPGTLSNTNTTREKPSYAEVNFRGGMTVDSWALNLFVNNVTDKRGVLRGGDDGLGPTLYNYTQPRTFGLSMSKDF